MNDNEKTVIFTRTDKGYELYWKDDYSEEFKSIDEVVMSLVGFINHEFKGKEIG